MKKVRFSEKITIHEVDISEDEKSARSGLGWIQAAADHARFQMRIKHVSPVLNDMLKKKKLGNKTM